MRSQSSAPAAPPARVFGAITWFDTGYSFLRQSRRLFFPRGGGLPICTRRSHLKFGHSFLAPYLASFGVEVSPAEYAVWTLWEMASGDGFPYSMVRQRIQIVRQFTEVYGRNSHIFHVEWDSGS